MKREAVDMPQASVTSDGRVTIPKPARDALDLRPGDRMDFDVREGAIVGRVRRDPDIMDLFERLPGIDRTAYDPEAEADYARNWWPDNFGISGRNGPEYPAVQMTSPPAFIVDAEVALAGVRQRVVTRMGGSTRERRENRP